MDPGGRHYLPPANWVVKMLRNSAGSCAVSMHTKPRPGGMAADSRVASSDSDAMKMANAFTFGLDVSSFPAYHTAHRGTGGA